LAEKPLLAGFMDLLGLLEAQLYLQIFVLLFLDEPTKLQGFLDHLAVDGISS
jgi:hypothetical protein